MNRRRILGGLAVVWALTVSGLTAYGTMTTAEATGGGGHKVTLCHKGKTITVDKHAAKAHAKHKNDYPGECKDPEPDPDPTTEAPDPDPTTEAPDPDPTTEAPDPDPTTEAPDPDPTTEAPASPDKPKAEAPASPDKPKAEASKPRKSTKSGSSAPDRSAPQIVDRNADGQPDVYGPDVVEEGF